MNKPAHYLQVAILLVLPGICLLLTESCSRRPERLSPAQSPEELVYVRSKDDIVNAGALFTPRTNAVPIAIIWIHGWGINFYSPTYVKIGRTLAGRSYTCMAVNTRMHDLGNVL